MKRKLKIWSGVVGTLAAFVAGVWWLATTVGGEGRRFWILFGALSVLGLAVAVTSLIYLLRKPAPPPPPKDAVSEEMQAALAGAEKKLAAARVAPSGALGKLPIVLLLGPPGSTKTSVVVRSGLDIEQLAGDVFRDDAVIATRGVNVWYGRNTIFLEPGRDIVDEGARWQWLMRRLQPARLAGALTSGQQAPRVAVVCYSCEALVAAGGLDAAAGAARALRDRLGQVAHAFGVRLPVYVVFTKADRVPGFAEYVQNFTRDETRAVVGATLPIAARSDGASFADRETRRLTDVLARLFAGLAAQRVEILARESVAERKPGAYEFPREVRKLGPAAVQFLVELCRPTELGVGPVLRGFYFAGVRAVVSGEAQAIPSLMAPRAAQAVAATSVFRPVAGPAAAAPPAPLVAGTQKKPEWVFLRGIFPDVILSDGVAMGVTRGGTRMTALRRGLAATGIGLAAALAIALTVSFFGNRELQRRVRVAAAATSALPRETVANPPEEALQRLDSLRAPTEELSRHVHEGPPFWLRWGLYSGDEMYPLARALYFDRFARLLYDSARVGLRRATAAVAAPGSAAPYDSTYRLLRAYLITTDHGEQSTPDFLAPILLDAWPPAGTVDSARRELARRQFAFFGSELRHGNPYDDRADASLVGAARDVLARSSGLQPIYQSILAEADRHSEPVRFRAAAANALVNPGEVRAAFTRRAWAFVTDTALGSQLDEYLQGEPWVTADVVKPPANREQLAAELRRMYVADYVDAWRRFVRSASVPGFASLQDASRKLEVLAGPTSPMLGMLLTVSEHSAVDSALVGTALQPVELVMPVANRETYVGGANQEYMDALGTLSNAVRQAANVPAGGDAAGPLDQAATATSVVYDAVGKLARQFSTEPEAQLALGALLLAPTRQVERLVNSAIAAKKGADEAAAINAATAEFCAQVRGVLDKFPFAAARTPASQADLVRVFKPDGQVSQFFEGTLQSTVLRRAGGRYVQAGRLAPTAELLAFMNDSRRITDALFPNNAPEPRVSVTVRAQLPEPVSEISLTVGDETVRINRGSDRELTTTWRFADTAYVALSLVPRRGSNEVKWGPGAWTPFQIYWSEARGPSPRGGKLIDVAVGTASGTVRLTLDMTIGGPASGLSDSSLFTGLRCPARAVR